MSDEPLERIAIVGMACRFPGANSISDFWLNLQSGTNSIARFSKAELEAAGVDPALVHNPDYVPAWGKLDSADLFDGSFFGMSPRDSEITNPQHRLFLECSWEALEDAGLVAGQDDLQCGVFAAAGKNDYHENIMSRDSLVRSMGKLQIDIGNDNDFLATQVSYRLDLRGPVIGVQTACSSSLTAVHLACMSLLCFECEVALAGGVSIKTPLTHGYLREGSGIGSVDGHCRAFDAQASGAVGGDGAGVVALKRLEDALANGDHIYAVIRGSAINNDGALRVGYTAPGVRGQVAAIRTAHSMADVTPDTIDFVEAHGAATPLGDAIEVSALTQVFDTTDRSREKCWIGSVKTNIGHLHEASGIAGLIKSVLALHHRKIPPNLHFESPNPELGLDASPFRVPTGLINWKKGASPRRACINSLGLGGTNAHVVIEEPPPVGDSTSLVSDPKTSGMLHVLPVSAKTAEALKASAQNLSRYLRSFPDRWIGDVAHSLQVGRKAFPHRLCLVSGRNQESANLEAAQDLESLDAARVFSGRATSFSRPVVFVFSGLGDQYVNMGLRLYHTEQTFRSVVEQCSEILQARLNLDLRSVLYPDGKAGLQESDAQTGLNLRSMLNRKTRQVDENAERLNQTWLAHPAVFVTEYALARLWMEWGIQPRAMLGYSIGEIVAACVSGVMTLEDALGLVAERARLISGLEPGAMLAVGLSENELRKRLCPDAHIAAINGDELCVVSGTPSAVQQLQIELMHNEVVCQPLNTQHPFHCDLLKPVTGELVRFARSIEIREPAIPYVSNVTGRWITREQVADPGYWATHMCQPVQFARSLAEMWQDPDCVVLEVGPGQSMRTLALANRPEANRSQAIALSTLPGIHDRTPEHRFLYSTLGKLWVAGVPVDFQRVHPDSGRKIPIPGYPFERQRYFISPDGERRSGISRKEFASTPDVGTGNAWVPVWQQSVAPGLSRSCEPGDRGAAGACVVLARDCDLHNLLIERLMESGRNVVRVDIGERFSKTDDSTFELDPESGDDFRRLIDDVFNRYGAIADVVHLWCADESSIGEDDETTFEAIQGFGFHSLLNFARGTTRFDLPGTVRMTLVASNLHRIEQNDVVVPAKTTVLAACKIVPQEFPDIVCQTVDVVPSEFRLGESEKLVDRVVSTICNPSADQTIAWRGSKRWVQKYDLITDSVSPPNVSPFRDGGIFLVIGGLNGIGFQVARCLAASQSKLVLIENSGVTPFGRQPERNTGLPEQVVSKRCGELESLGAEVLFPGGDFSGGCDLGEVCELAREKFGALNGIFHITEHSTAEWFQSIQQMDPETSLGLLKWEADNLARVEQAVGREGPSMVVLFSTLSSILGGLRAATWSAACHMTDALAHRNEGTSATSWLVVNMDHAHETGEEPRCASSTKEVTLAHGNCIDALQRVAGLDVGPQVVIADRDLRHRMNYWIDREQPQDEATVPGHKRPPLARPYIEPSSETEKEIATIWRELLGFEEVGSNDSFFDLGGHSLLGVRLISRLCKRYKIDLPLETIFEKPTIAEQARTVSAFHEPTEN